MIFIKKPLKLNFQLNFDKVMIGGREREETKIYLLQKNLCSVSKMSLFLARLSLKI